MLLVSTGAVGDNTRYVAHVFRRVAGHLLAATRSYLDVARRWCGCGRWHSARCRRLLSRCRAPVGRYPIVVGTFLDAARVWEMPRGTLPTSSGALPGPCWPLPGRSWYASSRATAVGDGTRHVAHVVRRVAGLPCAVTGRLRDISRVVHAVSAPVLHTFFFPPTSGVPDVQSFSRVRGSNTHAGRDHPRTACAAPPHHRRGRSSIVDSADRPTSGVSPRPRRGACFAANGGALCRGRGTSGTYHPKR